MKKKKCSFDFIITDYNMPHKNGLDVINYSKRMNKNLKDSIIFVISANKDRQITTSCLRAGASNFLQKPFNSEVVGVKVKTALVEIVKKNKDIESKLNKEFTEDELKIELLLNKINHYFETYSKKNSITKDEKHYIKKFLTVLPNYISEDDEFLIDFFDKN